MSEKTSEHNSKSETIFAKGKLFELVHKEQPDGRIFEVARRAPGVRLIISNKESNTILLTREFRQELQDWDYRLPGGKVFDSLDEYNIFLQSGDDISNVAKEKALAESIEEAGIEINSLEMFKKSTLGATVEWDLLIFEALEWKLSEGGQKLEVGEQIETDIWFSYSDVRKMILNGEMKEERIALILLQWITKQEEGENL